MNILQALEEACHSVYADAEWADIPQANVYRGIENETAAQGSEREAETRALPCIVYECQSADPSLQFTGNWTCHLRILVQSSSDDSTRSEHFNRVDEVFRRFFASDMVTRLNGANDFTCFQVRAGRQGYQMEGRRWVSFMDFDVECCGSDL